ncbi:MAG: succinate dehydrogenase cytochrome b subunit [Nitrospiraceae bacterium]|nr:MAG: succinate dehydrogenase cytochrome b subunit [Nitrospiraceae bacterium]
MRVLVTSQVGKKVLMAVSGQLMTLFVIVHMLGNTTLFFGGLNAYAAKLHSLLLLVWTARLLMLTALVAHVVPGIQLYLENRKAKPGSYAIRNSLRATFASKNMVWTGMIIGAFLIYHLLHFTFQFIHPEQGASANIDPLGRPDVSRMVLFSFQSTAHALMYITALTALLLHLTHGIQSSFQSLGLNTDRSIPVIVRSGFVVAMVLFLGYIAVPLIILLGILKG